ncbi:hypothetical protein BDAP_000183 [Binucleata daphniae]
MLVELHKEQEFGYIYVLNNKEMVNFEYTLVKTENIFGILVHKIKHKIDTSHNNQKFDFEGIVKNMSCKCTKRFNIMQINALPEEGWEDLIDFWSCHDSEFRSMLDLKPKPRKGGVLTGDFYFLINENESCCFKKQKIFYNEVFDEKTCMLIIYHFLMKYFKHQSKYILHTQNKVYELCFFDEVFIFENDEAKPALKLGIKQSAKVYTKNENINDFFCQTLYNELIENRLKITVFAYNITYFSL